MHLKAKSFRYISFKLGYINKKLIIFSVFVNEVEIYVYLKCNNLGVICLPVLSFLHKLL